MNNTNLRTGDDLKDLEQAQAESKEPARSRSFWQALGPGLVTGAADDDPTAVGTYSIAGAQFGYSLLWTFLVMTPLMISVQEMCGRIGLVTGKGLAGVMKVYYPKQILWPIIGALLIANSINIWADLNIMAASAQMLFGRSMALWLTIIVVSIVVAQILIPYRYYVKVLKWLALVLFSYVITALLPEVRLDFGSIVRNTIIPSWSFDRDFILTFFGLFGGTISPYLFFWQSGEQVEEVIAEKKANAPGERISTPRKDEIRMMRNDTIAGMVISQVIGFFMLACAIGTLNARGITKIETAQQAASALLPLGGSAYYLFTIGIFASGLLAIPALAGSAAYALAETFGWRWGLYRRFTRAQGFYLAIAAIILAGYALNFFGQVSPVRALLYAAVCNGIAAPPLILLLLVICNKRQVMGSKVNGKWANILGGITIIAMTIGAILSIWALVTGAGG